MIKRRTSFVLQIDERFHLDGAAVRLDFSDPTSLPENTAFLYNVTGIDMFYDIHIHYTEQELHRKEQEILKLEQELVSANDIKFQESLAKRKYKSAEVDNIALFDSVHKFINSTDQFYQYISDSGKVYLDTCKLEKEDLTKDDATLFESIAEMAKDAVGLAADSMQSFVYRTVKPNVGLEYQFYFIEQRRTDSPSSLDDKVYQITVLQPYGKLEIISKNIHPSPALGLIVPISKHQNATNVLIKLRKSCEFTQIKCNAIVVAQDSDLGIEAKESSESDSLKVRVVTTKVDIKNLKMVAELTLGEFSDNSVVGFLPPEFIATSSFLHRCFLNSLQSQAAYFPIHFQLYSSFNKDTDRLLDGHLDVSNEIGFWANAKHSVFCSHIQHTKSLDTLPATVADLSEDLTVRGLRIIRDPDPGLLRLWSEQDCDESESAEECEENLRYLNLR